MAQRRECLPCGTRTQHLLRYVTRKKLGACKDNERHDQKGNSTEPEPSGDQPDHVVRPINGPPHSRGNSSRVKPHILGELPAAEVAERDRSKSL